MNKNYSWLKPEYLQKLITCPFCIYTPTIKNLTEEEQVVASQESRSEMSESSNISTSETSSSVVIASSTTTHVVKQGRNTSRNNYSWHENLSSEALAYHFCWWPGAMIVTMILYINNIFELLFIHHICKYTHEIVWINLPIASHFSLPFNFAIQSLLFYIYINISFPVVILSHIFAII